MRQKLLLLVLASILAAAIAGCTKKASETASTATSDSLVASNPTEQTKGNLTPGQAPQEAPPPAPQAEAPKAAPPKPHAAPRPHVSEAKAPAEAPGVTVASGTAFAVVFTSDITSETAKAGDAWTGTLKENLIVGDRVVFPQGSVVHGTVRDAKPAEKGDRAMLDLAVTSIEARGQSHEIEGGAAPVVAGSTRTRNVGTVAGGAAAGALLGKAIGGSNKGALIGGLLGGAAAGAGVAASKGYQVEMKSGKEMSFTTGKDVKIKM